MSTKHQQKAEKKRARHDKRRAKATSVRKNKVTRHRSVVGKGKMEQAMHWPTYDCYVSTHWHEPEARDVHAFFVRRTDDGILAAAWFTLDLLDRKILQAGHKIGMEPGRLQNKLVSCSEPHGLHVQDPTLVVRLVTEGARESLEAGNTLPPQLTKAMELFGDLTEDDCTMEVQYGENDEDPNHAPRKLGFLTRFLNRLF